MASIVQSRTGGADGANRSITAALSSTARSGALLISAVAVDKNAGAVPAPSTGHTNIDGRASASITFAAARRSANASATDQNGWTWPTGMACSWWIGETDFDSTATLASLATWTNESAVRSVSLGAVVAPGDGLAIAFVAVDTIANWRDAGTGRAATWTNGFTEVAVPATPLFDTGMSVATKTVSSGENVSTVATAARASSTADQASGFLLVIGVASSPQTVDLDAAMETDGAPSASASPGAVTVGIDAATESDSPPLASVGASVTLAIDTAAENDTAPTPTLAVGGVTVGLDVADETDAAFDATSAPGVLAVELDSAQESDSAPPTAVSTGAVTIPLDVALEQDRAPSADDEGGVPTGNQLLLLGVG